MSQRLLKIAVIYALIGMVMGIAMGITENFASRPVHTHINLLGWVSMAVVALCYRAFPALAESALAKAHFWLHNLGLPVMMVGVWHIVHNNPELGHPVTGIGSLAVFAAMACFALNVWRNVGASHA